MDGARRKPDNGALPGSYTVEAAVLIPVILAVIIALIQICLVLHDRTVVRGVVELAALQAALSESEETGEGTEEARGTAIFAPETIEEQLLISEINDAGIRETRTDVEAFVQMESKRIVPSYFGIGDGFVRDYSAKRKKQYAKEKTIISEVLLDALHLLE